jgi:hypothetical protein
MWCQGCYDGCFKILLSFKVWGTKESWEKSQTSGQGLNWAFQTTRQDCWRLCLCVTIFPMSVLSLLVVEWFSKSRRACRNIFSTRQEAVSFYGSQGFTNVFRVAHHWAPSCVRWSQSISPSYPLSIYINISLPSALMSLKYYFPAFFSDKILHALIIPYTLIIFIFIILLTFADEYKFWSPSSWYLLQHFWLPFCQLQTSSSTQCSQRTPPSFVQNKAFCLVWFI